MTVGARPMGPLSSSSGPNSAPPSRISPGESNRPSHVQRKRPAGATKAPAVTDQGRRPAVDRREKIGPRLELRPDAQRRRPRRATPSMGREVARLQQNARAPAAVPHLATAAPGARWGIPRRPRNPLSRRCHLHRPDPVRKTGNANEALQIAAPTSVSMAVMLRSLSWRVVSLKELDTAL